MIHGKKSALPIRFLIILTATYCITETGGDCHQNNRILKCQLAMVVLNEYYFDKYYEYPPLNSEGW